MIKLEEEISRFAPIDLSTLENKLGGIPEEVKTAISMYNKAIGDIGNKNEDMAVIALRKAIALYPGFYEAMNLMGLCHISIGEEDKGRQLFEQVVKMDDSSLLAMSYLDILNGNEPNTSSDGHSHGYSRNRYAKALPAWLKRGLSPEHNGPWVLKYIVGFLFGVLCVSAVWLLSPGDKPLFSVQTEQPGLMDNVQALQEENMRIQETLADTVRDLDNANRIQLNMKSEMDEYKDWVGRVNELRDLVLGGQYREAVLKVDQNYSNLEIPSDIQEQMTMLYDIAKPKALKQIYDEAMNMYKGNAKIQDKEVYKQIMTEFDLAINILESIEEKPTYIIDLYYFAAKAYFLAGMPNQEEAAKKAVETFNKVIELGPKTAKGTSSATWIKEIQAGRTVKP